jgi:hypothetical protein
VDRMGAGAGVREALQRAPQVHDARTVLASQRLARAA